MGMKGRVAGWVLAVMPVAACFRSESWDNLLDAADSDDPSSSSGAESGLDTLLTSTVTGVASSSGGGGDTSGTGGGESDGGGDQGDLPPVIDALTINGVEGKAQVLSAAQVTIEAAVSDDHDAVSRVVFSIPGQEPITVAAPPYAVSLAINSDQWNGDHAIEAVAYDDAEQASAPAQVGLTVDLPAGGSVVWEWKEPNLSYYSAALDVAVDGEGNVVVAGYRKVGLDMKQMIQRFEVRKFDPSGSELWSRTTPQAAKPEGANAARGVAIDPFGNIVVVGEVFASGAWQSLIQRYTGSGAMIEQKLGQVGDHALDVAMAPSGAFVVGGYREKKEGSDAMVWAFDADGGPLWVASFAQISGAQHNVRGVALHPNGDVFGAGELRRPNKVRQGFVLQVRDGAPGWFRLTPELGQPQDLAHDVTISADGDVIAVVQRESESDQLWLLRLDPSGEKIDEYFDPTARCESDEGCALAIDVSGNVLVAGAVLAPGAGLNTLVRKFEGKWLSTAWTTVSDGFDSDDDRSLAVTCDKVGFVYTAGFQQRAGGRRLWVAKINP